MDVAPQFAVSGVSDAWQPWATPRGVDFLLKYPMAGVGRELGVDHAWLPVVHTHTMQVRLAADYT